MNRAEKWQKLIDLKAVQGKISEEWFLFEADLSGANLSKAKLSGANLISADLSCSDFEKP